MLFFLSRSPSEQITICMNRNLVKKEERDVGRHKSETGFAVS